MGVVRIMVDLADGHSLVCFFPLGMVQIKQPFLILGGGAFMFNGWWVNSNIATCNETNFSWYQTCGVLWGG